MGTRGWPHYRLECTSDKLSGMRGYFILEMVIFGFGVLAFLVGWIPITRRRRVQGSAARTVGIILMIPLPLYFIACKRSNIAPLAWEVRSLDPLKPFTEGFVKLSAMSAAFACVLAATVLAVIASELKRRS